MCPGNFEKLFALAAFTAASTLLTNLRRISDRFQTSNGGESADFCVDHYSTNLASVAVIDLPVDSASDNQPVYQSKCERIAEALREYGIVIIRDIRASAADNDAFINMMERSESFISASVSLSFPAPDINDILQILRWFRWNTWCSTRISLSSRHHPL